MDDLTRRIVKGEGSSSTMMVRYMRQRGFKGQGHDPLLTIGRSYLVLGIVLRPAPYSTQIFILTDASAGDHSDGKPYSDGGPGLFDMDNFDIADSNIPLGWSMVNHGQGYYGLSPNEFGGDFWDRFNDGESEAERSFEQVLEKLKIFHEYSIARNDKSSLRAGFVVCGVVQAFQHSVLLRSLPFKPSSSELGPRIERRRCCARSQRVRAVGLRFLDRVVVRGDRVPY